MKITAFLFSLLFILIQQHPIETKSLGGDYNNNPFESKSVNPIQDINLETLETGVICRAKCFFSCGKYEIKVLDQTSPSLTKVSGRAIIFQDAGMAAVLCKVTASFMGKEFSKWKVQLVRSDIKKIIDKKRDGNPLYKLTDGKKPNEGNLMVLVQDSYHYNCFTNITRETSNAQVICREMGYPGLQEFITDGRYTAKSQKDSLVHFYYQCVGNEANFDECETINPRPSTKSPCGKNFQIAGLVCKPSLSITLPNYKLRSGNNILRPSLSIQYSTKMPELGEPVIITCSNLMSYYDRQTILMYRNIQNGTRMPLIDSVFTDLSVKIDSKAKTVKLTYNYTFTPQNPSDTFDCVAKDLETLNTKTVTKSLKYKTPLSEVEVKVMTGQDEDITDQRNRYSEASYLLCDSGDVYPPPTITWSAFIKNGSEITKASEQFSLSTVETRMPVCCTAHDTISNKFAKACIVPNSLVTENMTLPMQNQKICEATSGKVECQENTNLFITKCALSRPPSCSVDDLNRCHSPNICSFIKEERCKDTTTCILKDQMFKKQYLMDMLKKYIPKNCFRGEFYNIQLQYFCLPK